VKVRIESSGNEFDVDDGESILDAALRHGYVLPYSCRDGACGTCKGKLISGEVVYPGRQPGALSDAERAGGLALFCQAIPRTDVVIQAEEVNAVADIEVKTLPCRVARMERVTHDVMVLYLKLPQQQRLQFLAGQYIDILLRDGRRRSFSLANAPHDDAFLQLHVRHVPDGYFTGYVFNRMQEKDLLRFRGPLGTFFLREDSDRPMILVAGGTGFAPIKGMVEHALHVGLKRPLHLYWGARARRDLYMDDLARSWAEDHALIRYAPVLSQPAADDRWEGLTGWVHEAVLADYPDLSGYEVYASGPPPMVDAVKASFVERGLPPERLFSDAFEYAGDGEGPGPDKKG
jgi:CDP-4-dehydro-6-deoxyglucose reductase